MELINGTGNLMLFLTPQSLESVYRPPMWWALVILIGMLTLINEPLVAKMINGKSKHQQPKRQPTNQQRFQQPQPTKPTNNRPTTPKSNPFSGLNWSNMTKTEKKILSTMQGIYDDTGQLVESPTTLSRAIYGDTKGKGTISPVLAKFRSGQFS